MGDVGSAVASQELGATLLENEQYLLAEIDAALKRIEKGNFGRCGNCGGNVSPARLVALPYARYCMDCAVALHAGRAVNMNEGRAANWEEGFGLRAEGPPVGAPGGPEERPTGGDPHAAGTPEAGPQSADWPDEHRHR